jgi:outer membrane protein assembly factor BamD
MKLRLLARLGLALAFAIGLAGCSGSIFGSSEKPLVSRPADVMYKEANEQLDKGNNNKAAEIFEDIDRQHPYSEEAKKSMLLAAYAYQKAGKLPEAVAAARRYLTLHPGTKDAALAQEIVASSYYDRITSPSRDQTETKKAIAELETLVRRYPDSRYVENAKKHIKLGKDMLAASEMNIARFYQKKGNFLAAVNRYRTVVTDYQQTSHVEEALMRLTECYMALGVVNEAQTAASVLGHNYPESQWYKDAFELLRTNGTEPREDSGSWITRTWKKISPST